MFFKLSLRTFWILLLVLSSLWVAAIFGPLLYSVLSPTDDLWAIVHALQGRGVPPSKAECLGEEQCPPRWSVRVPVDVGDSR
jgi:hypothetical protein